MERLPLLVAIVMLIVNTGCSFGPNYKRGFVKNDNVEIISWEDRDYGILRPSAGIPEILGAEANLRVATANAELTRALAKSIERNGAATATNTKLPGAYGKAMYFGLFMNHRDHIVSVVNPDFSVPAVPIEPGRYIFLPVKTIPEIVYMQYEGEKTLRKAKVFKKRKEYNGVTAEFGAVIKHDY